MTKNLYFCFGVIFNQFFDNSFNNQFLEKRQSRLIVSQDTCKTLAISSIVKPPKNFISTTQLFLSSNLFNSSKASFKAEISPELFSEKYALYFARSYVFLPLHEVHHRRAALIPQESSHRLRSIESVIVLLDANCIHICFKELNNLSDYNLKSELKKNSRTMFLFVQKIRLCR